VRKHRSGAAKSEIFPEPIMVGFLKSIFLL
jgi:hypothetical protein